MKGNLVLMDNHGFTSASKTSCKNKVRLESVVFTKKKA